MCVFCEVHNRCVVGLVMQGQHAALLSYPQVSVIEKGVVFLQHCRNIPYKWKNENAASIYAKFLQTLVVASHEMPLGTYFGSYLE